MSAGTDSLDVTMRATLPDGAEFEVSATIAAEMLWGPADSLQFLDNMTSRMGQALRMKVQKGLGAFDART